MHVKKRAARLVVQHSSEFYGILLFDMSVWKQFFISLTSTREKKVILENFLSLSFLQAANYLLPLVTLPYLVRVLGPEKFGLLAFAQALCRYFFLITDYGFIFSATKEIAINRDNIEKLSSIFSSVFFIKTILLTACLIFLAVLLMIVPRFRVDWIVYLYSFGVVVGYALFPAWFFQGMERMKYVTVLNIIGKLIFTISIFTFIRKQDDYLYVPLITSVGSIFVGLVAMVIVYKDFGMKFTRLRYGDVKYHLSEGWHTFISLASVALYTNTNVFVLGMFTSNTLVGYYSAAEKMLFAVQKIIETISQSVFPYISKLASVSRAEASEFLKKLASLSGRLFFFISLTIFIFAGPIVKLLLGTKYSESIIILRIFAFMPFIVALSNTYIVQGLYAFGHQRVASRYIGIAAIVYLPIMIAATYYFHYVGTALCFLVIEIFIAVLSKHYYFKVLGEYAA